MAEVAALNDIDVIFDIYNECVKKLDDRGIYQWDNIYPDYNTIKNDIELGQMYIIRNFCDILACGVINDDTEGYENGRFSEESFKVIHRLCVKTNVQGSGLGVRMLEELEKIIFDMGVKSICLDVFPQNMAAINLYAHRGYKEVGSAFYRKGRFILMEKIF